MYKIPKHKHDPDAWKLNRHIRCDRVKNFVECNLCGYPYSEALHPEGSPQDPGCNFNCGIAPLKPWHVWKKGKLLHQHKTDFRSEGKGWAPAEHRLLY
jgi:rubredoxin